MPQIGRFRPVTMRGHGTYWTATREAVRARGLGSGLSLGLRAIPARNLVQLKSCVLVILPFTT